MVVVVGWTFIGLLLHVQSVGLHLSHYMKFYDTMHGYNMIPANTGGAFPNMVEKKRVAGIVPGLKSCCCVVLLDFFDHCLAIYFSC